MVLTPYRRMLGYVRPYVPRLGLAMLFMVGVSALTGSVAFLVKPVLDDIFIRRDATRLAFVPFLVMAIYLVRAVFEFSHIYLMTGAGQRVVRDIRQHLYSHMQSLSLSFYLRHPAGVLMSRVMNDVALMAYNAGPNRILGHLRAGGIPERYLEYPRRVRAAEARLRALLAAEPPAKLAARDSPLRAQRQD
jgi:ABC-type multidrug transport system fused ATPase/permease subunit